MRPASYITPLPENSREQPHLSVDKTKPKRLAQLREALCSRHYSRALRLPIHLLESGHGISTVQELPWHKDFKATMISTHVLNKGSGGVRSRVDRL